MPAPAIRFCPTCGAPVALKVPEGDSRPRFVCTACGHVHYQNPRMVVGCIPEWQGRLLVCRRAIEPRLGYWTIPAGFLENGESLHAGAARETLEEACAQVEVGSPVAIVNVLRSEQVHVMFRAQMRDGQHAPGAESLETALVDVADIPWQDLAFSSVRFALERYLEDRGLGREGLHFHDIGPERP
jgi:ADP-ribose pyrophosphatase YjhB (NUDIX family)